jgi:polysaccharide chain length determinant protein (PEP-CTERM system associated)
MNVSPQNPDTKVLIHDYLDIIWRRKWWLVVPILISLVSGMILFIYLPKLYRSSTLILVEAQKVPEDYVKSAVSGTIEDRLATIRQQILSRSLLQKIIDEFGLYKKELKNQSNEELLDLMRKNIEIKTDGTRKTVDAFTISFEGNDPKTVMEVTNKLASLYIEENLKVREQLVEGTTDFLEKELVSLKVSLDKQEQQIGDHKRKFMGSLPQQLDANLRSLDRHQMELQTISTSLMMAEEKKNALEAKIKGSSLPAITEGSSSPQSGENPAEDDFENLIRLKKSLAVLRMDYTDAYPDIVVLKRRIKELEDSLSHNQGAVKEQEKDRSKEKQKQSLAYLKTNNPELQKQLEDVTVEIRSLKEREQTVSNNIRQLEKAVEQTPMREQEMDVILRDYENTKKAYQSLLDKKLNAELSGNLEKRQKGEQFRILDPANLPQKPFKPDRVRLVGLSLALGLGIGFGLVLLRETLDTSFKKPEEIENELGLPLLAAIPEFSSKEQNLKSDRPIIHETAKKG